MSVDLSPAATRLIAESPAADELRAFVAWMSAERYTAFVMDQHARRLAYIVPRLPGCAPQATYTEAQLAAVFGRERAPTSRYHRFAGTRRAYTRFLRAASRLATDRRPPYADVREQYARYLVEVRGLSASARHHHGLTVADLLSRGIRRGRSLRTLRREDVERFVLLRSKEISRHSLQHVVAHLRAFLRYAHDHGHLERRLDALDTPRTYRDELPPRAMPWDTVLKLLASIDPDSKSGRRDLCILHLMAYYGLRPSEVVALRLDSVDWKTEVLHVFQRKTRSSLALPLMPATLRLLKQYLRRDRSRRDTALPELFLRARCPFIPLQRTCVGDIFERRMLEAGLPGCGKHVYRLRHTLAMRLLSRGVGVKAIGDVLGHRSLYGTCAYLRLDLAMLRCVALEVPRGASRAGGRHA